MNLEIKETQPRVYQEKIFGVAAKTNTLAVLPTGLGKTFIALMLAVHRIQKICKGSIKKRIR